MRPPSLLTPKTAMQLTHASDILAATAPFRPSRGGTISASRLHSLLGATHCAGRYSFTTEPYLIEGARVIHERLDYRHLKLWFYECEQVYSQNSNWARPRDHSMVWLAKHPYYTAAFDLPFETIALEVKFSCRGEHHPRPPGHMIAPDLDFAHEEQELYDLARHFLETYRRRDITFILQNWEGDWMLREFPGAQWTDPAKVPADIAARLETFTRWVAIRQRAVDRARADVPDTRCRVLHAVEVNRVFDALLGAPTVASHVLPQVEVDLVSWSSYDGMQCDAHGTGDGAAIGMWQGLEIIRHYARTRLRDSKGRPQVMIGEFGLSETRLPDHKIPEQILEGTLAACLAQDTWLLHYWELYCNEPLDQSYKDAPLTRNLRADELNGLWLINTDNQLSRTGAYFASLLRP